ncbi:hypothetical protein M1D49_03900 [Bacillus sp. PK3-056]|uniref:hypothetical protein n=1 Tax=Niallia circulans TaxID=1397 RepID=UPI000315A641|nr:hypothetical protein [Niallia circulans]QJX63971.1 hypothetical protein HLK66_21565 [Niallia circulans]
MQITSIGISFYNPTALSYMDEQKSEESSVFLFVYIGREIFIIINIDILYSNSKER